MSNPLRARRYAVVVLFTIAGLIVREILGPTIEENSGPQRLSKKPAQEGERLHFPMLGSRPAVDTARREGEPAVRDDPDEFRQQYPTLLTS